MGIRTGLNSALIAATRPDLRVRSLAVERGAELGRGVWVMNGVVLGRRAKIGRGTYLNRNSMVLSGQIGRYCSIGYGAIVGPPEHPEESLLSSRVSALAADYEQYRQHTKIGDDVWIGAYAVIRQGVVIGTGSIVGAGSVVTQDVPPFSVAYGVPARVQRARRVSENLKRLIVESNILDGPPETISKALAQLDP